MCNFLVLNCDLLGNEESTFFFYYKQGLAICNQVSGINFGPE
jgi:hypothetical protein